MTDVQIRKGTRRTKPYEYFCKDCRQLRWSCTLSSTCGNCGSSDIIKGEPGTLNKRRLINETHKKTKTRFS